MTISSTLDGAQKVWRYFDFSRFVWLVQKKRLWLARVDTLDDPWESALAGDQLAHVISRHPIPRLSSASSRESAIDRATRITTLWRQTTFVNCWSASDHESHALWRIFCGKQGVAIQTTVEKLQASLGGLRLHRITYETPGAAKRTPERLDLVTKKRPMFDYEREVRIVLEKQDFENGVLGHEVDWDLEKHVEFIRVHPEADNSFLETVSSVVDDYAPALKGRVAWSAMKEPPPLAAMTPGVAASR